MTQQQLTLRSFFVVKVLQMYQLQNFSQRLHCQNTGCGTEAYELFADGDQAFWRCPRCGVTFHATDGDAWAAYQWIIKQVGQDGLDAFLRQG